MKSIRPIDAIDLMIHRSKWARLWFWIWVGTVGAGLVSFYLLTESLTREQKFVIMDPGGTYYVADSTDFEGAGALHVAQTTLAMEALFDRNPGGCDHSKRLELLFSREAWKKAMKIIGRDSDEFRHKELHQKVEVGPIEILRIRDRSVLTHARGQLIRSGMFGDKPITEVLEVTAQFKFILNTDMVHNGRFPSVVVDFDYETALAAKTS